jgi:UDP-glucose:(heptosyl)LPS alpha-1,3-glucosyltransferase
VGGEWGRKGLEPAIQALGLTSGWDLLVVGEGDTERYRKVADRVGVAGRVHWIGVSRDVALLYELADLLVFPSSYEAFPLVVLEAAAAGLAILSTPVNGVRELIRDGSNGFLISSEPEDIAERLRQLAADPALLSRLGRAAREAALEFSWERMIEEHRALYQEAAGNSGAGRRRPVRVA